MMIFSKIPYKNRSSLLRYLAFQSVEHNCSWRWLFQKRVVRT